MAKFNDLFFEFASCHRQEFELVLERIAKSTYSGQEEILRLLFIDGISAKDVCAMKGIEENELENEVEFAKAILRREFRFTPLLRQWVGHGDSSAKDKVGDLVGPYLRMRAHKRRKVGRHGDIHQPTAVANEAWVKLERRVENLLAESSHVPWDCREDFLKYLEAVMTSVIGQHYRKMGRWQHVSLFEDVCDPGGEVEGKHSLHPGENNQDDLEASLDRVLGQFSSRHSECYAVLAPIAADCKNRDLEQLVRILSLFVVLLDELQIDDEPAYDVLVKRSFEDRTIYETSVALGISVSSVKRYLKRARDHIRTRIAAATGCV